MSRFDTPDARRAAAAKDAAFAELSDAQRRVSALQGQLTRARRELKAKQAVHARARAAWLDVVESDMEGAA